MPSENSNEIMLILKPTSTVRTLKPYRRETLRTRPTLPVVVKASDVAPLRDAAEKLWTALQDAITVPAIVQFAQINNLLQKHGLLPKAHNWLHTKFLRLEIREAMERLQQRMADAGDRPDLTVVFHRLTCLFILKLLLGVRNENMSGAETAETIGDLALLGNEFTKRDHAMSDHLATIAAFLPEWEIENRTNVPNAIARVHRMLFTHLSGADAKISHARSQLALDVTRIDGIPHEAYFRLVATVFQHIMTEVDRQGRFAFHPADLTTNVGIEEEDVTKFFAQRGVTRSEFRAAVAGTGWTLDELRSHLSSDRFATDATVIRRRPFLRLDDGSVLVLDVGSVIDLISNSIYYSLFNSFPRANQRDQFAEMWGRVFELYVIELLQTYYPPNESALIRPPTVLRPFLRFDDVEVDAVLDRERSVIVMELKASRLDLNAKLSRDAGVIDQQLHRKFVENERGEPKALRQLARSSRAILEGRVPRIAVPDVVYPLLISEERGMEAFEMNAHLGRIFDELRDPATTARVRPLTTMSINELEEVLPYVADEMVTWEELLESRFTNGNVQALSVHQALYNLTLVRSLPGRRNDVLRRFFEAIFPAKRGDQ